MSRRARAKRTELDVDNEGGGTHGVQVGLRPCGVDPAPGDVVMPSLTRGTVSSAPPPLYPIRFILVVYTNVVCEIPTLHT